MPKRAPPPQEEWTGRELAWRPGSIGVVDYVLRPGGPPWDVETKAVYLTLFSYMGESFTSRPKVETVAAGSGVAKRTVQRRLNELEAAGYIESDRDELAKGRPKGEKRAPTYKLWPPWCPNPAVANKGVTQSPLHSPEEEGCHTDTYL